MPSSETLLARTRTNRAARAECHAKRATRHDRGARGPGLPSAFLCANGASHGSPGNALGLVVLCGLIQPYRGATITEKPMASVDPLWCPFRAQKPWVNPVLGRCPRLSCAAHSGPKKASKARSRAKTSDEDEKRKIHANQRRWPQKRVGSDGSRHAQCLRVPV